MLQGGVGWDDESAFSSSCMVLSKEIHLKRNQKTLPLKAGENVASCIRRYAPLPDETNQLRVMLAKNVLITLRVMLSKNDM